ncbi:hypothetical protein L9F63_016084, partial [Diploptera punctata]
MVAQAQIDYGLQNRGISQIANSKEVLPGKSTESLASFKNTSAITEKANKNDNNVTSLKRELGLFSAVNLNVGCIIGSGIFISPGIALLHSGSIGLCLIVWVICGCISLLGALAYAELSTVVPRSGAEYAYFLEAFGELHKFWGPMPAFILSLIHVFVLSPTSIAVILLTFSEYICQPFTPYMTHLTEEELHIVKKIIAILGLGLLTYINFTSVKLYVHMQNIFTVSKMIVCAVVIFGGIYQLCAGNTKNFTNIFEGSTTDPKSLALAFYGCLWSYGGWTAITIVTEEVKKPEVNILRTVVIGMPLVTAIYILMNIAYMIVLTIPEILQAPAVAV